jgi:hypothetical protein
MTMMSNVARHPYAERAHPFTKTQPINSNLCITRSWYRAEETARNAFDCPRQLPDGKESTGAISKQSDWSRRRS